MSSRSSPCRRRRSKVPDELSTKYRNTAIIELSDSSLEENSENVSTNPMASSDATPKKRRGRPKKCPTNADDDVSPTKQTKFTSPTTGRSFNPVVVLNRLTLESSSPPPPPPASVKPDKFQNARKTLTSAETYTLPGRERELQQLSEFLSVGLATGRSASMYISGQPGTGKTACLSKLLNASEFSDQFKRVYVNCTAIASIGSIYKRICSELGIKAVAGSVSEKDYLANIERYFRRKKHPKQTVLMVLDEVDQLVGKKQSVLYTIFEWPSVFESNFLLVGIANSLDLTDRLLSRLHAKCDLKPKLMHFAPYTKQQIVDIFRSRLEEAQVLDIFPAVTIQLLAAKVSSISGDVRRALDIGRRVIEMAEEQKRNGRTSFDVANLDIIGSTAAPVVAEKVEVKQVMQVLNQVYGASQTLGDDMDEGTFPLQQKILICTVLMILKRDKNKDITVGRLYGVYARVCGARNIAAIGQSEFAGLCGLVETRGILRIIKNREPRLCKVQLQWDEAEVTAALQDKQLIASILADTSCIVTK